MATIGATATSLVGVTDRPQLYLDELIDATRRTGTRRHQIFNIVEDENGRAKFAPALAFDSQTTTSGRDEACALTVENGALQIEVSHSWPSEPGDEESTHHVALEWDPKTGLYDASPLKHLVTGNGFADGATSSVQQQPKLDLKGYSLSETITNEFGFNRSRARSSHRNLRRGTRQHCA